MLWIEKSYNLTDEQNKLIEKISKSKGLDRFVATLLCSRTKFDENEIEYFLADKFKPLSPKGLKDMDKAVEVIISHMRKNNKILNSSDFDFDGVSAAAALNYTFIALGYKNYKYYIPDKQKEVYGLSCDIVERAHRDNVKLIITTDNGIAAFSAIDRARELGIEVIVTDHHEIQTRPEIITVDGKEIKQTKYVDAVAIVNPHREDDTYRYNNLSGGMIAYKLSQALIMSASKESQKYFIESGIREKVISIAALSAIADVMEILGENRALVKEALKYLAQGSVPAVKLFVDEPTVTSLTYSVIPVLNSRGRLDQMRASLDLLLEEDPEKLTKLKVEFDEFNQKRKDLEAHGIEEAIKIISSYKEIPKVIIEVLPDTVPPTVLGLVAGKVKDRMGLHRPVILFSQTANGDYKGSGRSIEEYDMFNSIAPFLSVLSRGGGHPMACGLGADNIEQIEKFRGLVLDNCTLTEEDITPKLYIDKYISINDDLEKLYNDLKVLEPFANGNREPVLAMKNIYLDYEYKTYKKGESTGEFAKFIISDDADENTMEGVCWNENIYLRDGQKVFDVVNADIIADLEMNSYTKKVQLKIKNIKFRD